MVEKRVVKVIPATPQLHTVVNGEQKHLKRVAAYCRVSTDSEEQASSYEAQVEYYTNYIKHRSDWEFAGIFADDGISGTNTKKRTEFNRMIQACIDGQINMIVTKSISRFARNTLDCLKYIRQLKEYNVPVFFEKENINTMDSKGEVLLTIMASLAQQESESISKNVKMGIQYRYQKGEIRINHNRFLGYTKDAEGKLVIDPVEAEVVKRIFREYINGKSLQKIAEGLMADGIKTAANKDLWRGETIRKILANEKYMGDALLQKTYTVDVLNKKRVVNNGIVPQYYVENSHEAIISKELFHKVQAELQNRASPRNQRKERTMYSSKYFLSNILTCEKCGHCFRRIVGTVNGKKYINWRCKTRVTKGVKCCDAESISEETLHNYIVRAINRLIGKRENVLDDLNTCISETISNTIDLESINTEIEKLQSELEERIYQNVDYSDITTELDKLIALKSNHEQKSDVDEITQSRLSEIREYVDNQSTLLENYDEDLARKLLSQVVVGDREIEVKLLTDKSIKLKKFKT